MTVFAERLLIALRRRKMLQRDLAKALNMSQRAISKYVTGESLPPADRLGQIADVLNVSADWLLGRTDMESGFYPGTVPTQYQETIKTLSRAIQCGSEPMKRALVSLAEAIIKEAETRNPG